LKNTITIHSINLFYKEAYNLKKKRIRLMLSAWVVCMFLLVGGLMGLQKQNEYSQDALIHADSDYIYASCDCTSRPWIIWPK